MTIKSKKKFKFIIEKTRTGFSAYSEDLPVYTVGGTMIELSSNILEAINYYFEEDDLLISPANIILEFDLKQFFEYYRVINAKFLAERIGMNETLLSSYVKGRKKPSKVQVDRILAGIHEIGLELSELRFVVNDPEK